MYYTVNTVSHALLALCVYHPPLVHMRGRGCKCVYTCVHECVCKVGPHNLQLPTIQGSHLHINLYINCTEVSKWLVLGLRCGPTD